MLKYIFMHKHILPLAFPLLVIMGSGCGQNLHKRAAIFIDKQCDCFHESNISLSDDAEKFLEAENTGYYNDLPDRVKEELREFVISVEDPTTKLGACLHKVETDDNIVTPDHPELNNNQAEKFYRELEKITNSRKDDCKLEYYSRKGITTRLYNLIEGK
jgi:hypothetical protein